MIDFSSRHPFYSANDFYKEKFGKKIIKLAIDAGFTCPNRDGKLSTEGCIFCSGKGSGDFAASSALTISEQYHQMVEKMSGKWKDGKFLMYFQAFTNTYANVDVLKNLYTQALSLPNVVGLAIATRPDCLDEDILNLLEKLNNKAFIQVELGLQTSNDRSVKLINRCYDNDVYEKAIKKLNKLNIHTVTHVILGLPDETFDDMLSTVKYAINCGTDGIKLQLLHILKSTRLYDYYTSKPFKIFTYDQYVKTVVDIIERIPQNVVIHRITGDANKADMFEPWWSLDKRRVLNGISKEFAVRNTYQGKKIMQ